MRSCLSRLASKALSDLSGTFISHVIAPLCIQGAVVPFVMAEPKTSGSRENVAANSASVGPRSPQNECSSIIEPDQASKRVRCNPDGKIVFLDIVLDYPPEGAHSKLWAMVSRTPNVVPSGSEEVATSARREFRI